MALTLGVGVCCCDCMLVDVEDTDVEDELVEESELNELISPLSVMGVGLGLIALGLGSSVGFDELAS